MMDDANVEQAFKVYTFAAVRTCSPRRTSLRRLVIHSLLYDTFVERLIKTYSTICMVIHWNRKLYWVHYITDASRYF
jgi:acyl-CoA reductase-like NAD-dependent aldehyde dehydrogenase